jgi:hypothetical protein
MRKKAVITAQRGERIESTLGCTRNRLFVQPDQLWALP